MVKLFLLLAGSVAAGVVAAPYVEKGINVVVDAAKKQIPAVKPTEVKAQ